jgi:acyl-CoA synthetase (NDP forming)
MPGTAITRAEALVADAHARGLATLLETDAFELLDAAGLRCPRRLFARTDAEVATLDLAALRTERAVVKVVSATIAHKTDIGGVAIVENAAEAVGAAIRRMQRDITGHEIAGYSIAACVSYDAAPGGEWLLGVKWTDEFGPVVTIGAGGVATEVLNHAMQPGRDVAILRPGRTTRAQIEAALRRLAFTPLAIGGVRKQAARVSLDRLAEAVEALSALAPVCRPDALTDIEINPLVVSNGEVVALDVLAMVGRRTLRAAAPRPLDKLRNLLTPKSVALAGVSTQLNPGHVILNNLIREGFDRGAIYVIKPGATQIEGCRAVASVSALPDPVDLLILSISASQVPEVLIETIEQRKAESIVVIPGGLEEKSGTGALVAQMHDALRASRTTDWRGPVVNGGNCLGIQSRPGRYDTMFLPSYKMGATPGPLSPLAIVSQSGAFAASKITRLVGLRPQYCITVGNQMDLTIGDYLQHLEADPSLRVFGVYVEGFKALDGAAALDAIARITSSGRTVILYRAGRTQAGAQATASHTASLAGDYPVTRELARAAGAVVAETLDDFTDLMSLFTLLQQRAVYGRRLGALSNAGYECVAIADSLGDLELTPFTERTDGALAALFDTHRLSTVVDIHNPLDLTPMMDDEGYEAAVRRVLEDNNVDVGVIGCVPATPALNTLPAGQGHPEDLLRDGSLAQRLIRLKDHVAKPWVVVVDAGAIYDPLARMLQEGGIPTFRAADRALRLLNVFVADRFTHTVSAQLERWVDEFSVSPAPPALLPGPAPQP